jgi:squalene synthase HpnC
MGVPPELTEDYRRCLALAARHYENFTVISRFLPSQLRPHLAAIYAYCRGVDDLGDEVAGDRGAALDAWEEELERALSGTPSRAEFRALQHTISRFDLPEKPLRDLLAANRQDQVVKEYATFEDLLDYCALSANPVGRLVLALFGFRDEERYALSDATCTALQLTNFWQDVPRDLDQGRLYIPLADLAAEGLDRAAVERRTCGDERLRRVLAVEIARTEALFARGAALEGRVPRRLALQLRLYRLGGEAILQRLKAQGGDPFVGRPTLGRGAKLALALRGLLTGVLSRGSAA